MQAALDRHLQEEGCSYSILKDAKFSNSYKVLNDKAIVQQENEKGKRLRKADVLTENEEEHLLCSGVLGPDSLTTLFSCQHFGTQGRQVHYPICINDLKAERNGTARHISHVRWDEGPGHQRRDKMALRNGQDHWCRS